MTLETRKVLEEIYQALESLEDSFTGSPEEQRGIRCAVREIEKIESELTQI